MTYRRIARLLLGAVLGSTLATVAPAAPAQAVEGTVVGKVNPPALWYKIAGEVTDADAVAAASRYRVVILQSWQVAAAKRIKSLNPAVTVLAYKDLSSASWAEAALYNERNGLPMATGVGYLDAEKNGWLALDTNGNRIVWEGYPNLWQTEVWNPGYQQRWVDNVTRELAGQPVWDGVFGDDALTTLRYYSDATLAEAPTDAELQAGEEALIRKAADALHGMGKKLVLNISGATDNLAVWTRWTTIADGGMLEHYAHWGTNPDSASNYLWDWGSKGWTAGVQALSTSRLNVAVTTSADTDNRSYRYGLASFLIANGGHGAYTAVDSYKKAPFRTEQSWDLGYATAPMVKVGAAYTRAFPAGFAAVNPSKDQTVTVTLPVPMQDVTGATVSKVTLGPLTGAVFKGTSTATTPTTTTPTSGKKGKWRHYAPVPLTAPAPVTAPTGTVAAPAAPAVAGPRAATPRGATGARPVGTAPVAAARPAAAAAVTAAVRPAAAQPAVHAPAAVRGATVTAPRTAARVATRPAVAPATPATPATGTPAGTATLAAALLLVAVAGTRRTARI
jgi:hypothetical protein